MRSKIFNLTALIFIACTCFTHTVGTDIGAKFDQSALIPRTVLFDYPHKVDLRISPDGTKISYLAPDAHNVLNIWVKSIDADDDVCISSATDRGIYSYWWAHDMSAIFYAYDQDGKENTHLYAIDLRTRISTNLTPYPDTKVHVLAYHREYPTRMLIEMNKDDKQCFDVYELNLTTRAITLREKNPGMIIGYMADRQLIIRGALRNEPDGSKCLLHRDSAGTWQPLVTWPLDDAFSHPITFHRNGKILYMLDSRDSDTTQLATLDLETGGKTIIATQPGYDMTGVFLHPDTDEPLYAANSKDHGNVIVLDPQFNIDIQNLSQLKAPWDIVSYSADFNTFIITTTADTQITHYYWYNRPTKQLKFLCSARPTLDNYCLQPMQCIDITSRDGLTLHSYLTLPYGQRANLPLVLFVHGGPWDADRWGYNSQAQLLANRGYAVLQVNFRGSSGFGKAFLNAGNKEWGGKMHNDLIDAVNWAIGQKIADPTHIAIMGASYGGYAALAGVTFTPDTFCCAVDLFGISNLFTRLSHAAPYLKPWMATLYKRVGDPIADEALLKQRSPLFSAQCICKPIFIAQGANDVRCTMVESQQIVQALKERNIAHDYMVFENEGHGLAKPENRLAMYAAIERFLACYLGGRCE